MKCAYACAEPAAELPIAEVEIKNMSYLSQRHLMALATLSPTLSPKVCLLSKALERLYLAHFVLFCFFVVAAAVRLTKPCLWPSNAVRPTDPMCREEGGWTGKREGGREGGKGWRAERRERDGGRKGGG